MDLLAPSVPLDLSDNAWKIYARNAVRPPQYIAPESKVQNTLISEGTEIYGSTEFSVLFPNVLIEPGAKVHDSIIMNGSIIRAGAVVEYSIIAENVEIGEGACIGRRPENMPDKENWGISVIASNVHVGAGAVIGAKQMVDTDIPASREGVQDA
jgi:glucose-1-phosphate adenylyltransferase